MDEQLKSNIFKWAAICSGILAVAAVGWWFYQNSLLSDYTGRNPSFHIKYPSGWQAMTKPQAGVVAAFVSPKENALDVLQENINITVEPVPDTLSTVASFSQMVTKQMTAVFKTNIKIVEDRPIQFGNRPGHQLVFEAPAPNKLKVLVCWTIKVDKVFILTFLTTMDKYPEQVLLLDRIIKSFEIL